MLENSKDRGYRKQWNLVDNLLLHPPSGPVDRQDQQPLDLQTPPKWNTHHYLSGITLLTKFIDIVILNTNLWALFQCYEYSCYFHSCRCSTACRKRLSEVEYKSQYTVINHYPLSRSHYQCLFSGKQLCRPRRVRQWCIMKKLTNLEERQLMKATYTLHNTVG